METAVSLLTLQFISKLTKLICPICSSPFLMNTIEQHIFIVHIGNLDEFQKIAENTNIDSKLLKKRDV